MLGAEDIRYTKNGKKRVWESLDFAHPDPDWTSLKESGTVVDSNL